MIPLYEYLFMTFLLLLALYLAPIIGRNQIPPIAAQVLGCSAVLAMYTAYVLRHPTQVEPLQVWWFFVYGGIPSFVGFGLDKLDAFLNRYHAQRALVEGQDDEQPGRPHG